MGVTLGKNIKTSGFTVGAQGAPRLLPHPGDITHDGVSGLRLWDGNGYAQLTVDGLHVREFVADEVRLCNSREMWS
jgi:hypothetical protein